jgi:hypothetical protein
VVRKFSQNFTIKILFISADNFTNLFTLTLQCSDFTTSVSFYLGQIIFNTVNFNTVVSILLYAKISPLSQITTDLVQLIINAVL